MTARKFSRMSVSDELTLPRLTDGRREAENEQRVSGACEAFPREDEVLIDLPAFYVYTRQVNFIHSTIYQFFNAPFHQEIIYALL